MLNAIKWDYATTQVDLPELENPIKSWVKKNLKRDWLAPDGLEKNPHVTLLYGLLSDNPGQTKPIAKQFGKTITLTLDELDFFSKPDHDVLFISVASKDLHKLQQALDKLPNETDYKLYKPHVTIAYLKKGYAKQFKGQKPFKEIITKNGFTFGKRDDTKEFIPTIERSPLFGDLQNQNPL